MKVEDTNTSILPESAKGDVLDEDWAMFLERSVLHAFRFTAFFATESLFANQILWFHARATRRPSG